EYDGFFGAESISPDGRTILVDCQRDAPDDSILARLAQRFPRLQPLFGSQSPGFGLLLDAESGRRLGVVPAFVPSCRWSPDGQMIAMINQDGRAVQLWDVPPRKPRSWFAAGATLMALPLAWLAGRRVRRLRRRWDETRAAPPFVPEVAGH